MICKNCGCELIEGSAFCGECGSAVKAMTDDNPPVQPDFKVATPQEIPTVDPNEFFSRGADLDNAEDEPTVIASSPRLRSSVPTAASVATPVPEPVQPTPKPVQPAPESVQPSADTFSTFAEPIKPAQPAQPAVDTFSTIAEPVLPMKETVIPTAEPVQSAKELVDTPAAFASEVAVYNTPTTTPMIANDTEKEDKMSTGIKITIGLLSVALAVVIVLIILSMM